MADDEVTQGGGPRDGFETAGDVPQDGHRVGRPRTRHLVDHPQCLLPIGSRDLVRPLDLADPRQSGCLLDVARTVVAVDGSRHLRHCRVIEDRTHRDRLTQCVAQSSGQTHREQRMTTHVEEVRINRHLGYPEGVCDGGGDRLLQLAPGLPRNLFCQFDLG